MIHMLFLLVLVSLCFIIKRKWARLAMLLAVLAFCAREVFLGQSQLSGNSMSNSYIYSITGSFLNPGPYGGFIAVCMSILTAYIVKNRSGFKKSTLTKLFLWVLLAVVFAAIVTLPVTLSRSAMLAFGCSMVLLAAGTDSIKVAIKPILKKYGLLILLGVSVLGAGAYLFKKPSADGRLFMDRMSIRAMLNNGLKGAGIGHFGGAYGEAQADYFKSAIEKNGKESLDWSVIDEHDRITADCPDNPFNEYLFIGVEAGPIAMILFIGVVVLAIVISFRRGTVWCYGMISFAVFALFSYPLHLMQFRIMFAALLAACLSDRLTVVGDEVGKKTGLVPKLAFLSSVLVSLIAVTIVRLPEIRQKRESESVRWIAEELHKKEKYGDVVTCCDSLFRFYRDDYRFLFIYGQSLNKTGNYEKSDSVLKMGARISCDPMFWNVMGNNSLARGQYREAEECYKRAFYTVPNRVYPLFLLAKLYQAEGDVDAFSHVADKMQTFVPKVESDNTERLRNEIRETYEAY